MTLQETITHALQKRIAIGHFNFSDSATLRAISAAARELKVPVLVGTSEGERDYLGVREAVALVRALRDTYAIPIFINADHTHSFEKVVEAVEAGYDAILFDGGKLPFEENIRETKRAVEYVKSKNPDIVVEGELGYIGSSSEVLKEIPAGAAIEEKDLTTAEDAVRFVEETGVDMLAPAVGNIHGMFANAPNPRLNIARVRAIAAAVKVPLVLHGGSGTVDEDFVATIDAGVSVIHISTELRRAWRTGVEAGLRVNPEEVAPYKIMEPALRAMQQVVHNRLALFNKIPMPGSSLKIKN